MKLSLLSALLLLAARAAAHDFWIEPADFRLTPGQSVAAALRVGESFKGEPVVRKPQRIVRFVLIGPAGETPLEGRPGDDPAGRAIAREAGPHTIVYQSNHAEITLEPAKFNAYLQEEGLTEILAERKKAGGRDPVREKYSRSAKALLSVEPREPPSSRPTSRPAARVVDSPRGLPLEIVAESDVRGEMPRAGFVFRVLLDGEPLPGIALRARNRATPSEAETARTDEEGRVRLPLGEPGTWMVTCVYMHAAPAELKADYESFWASLTFERPDVSARK